MTKIEGRVDDDLLTQLGYGGHPTLAFMNPDGVVVGRPRDRSVASFREALKAIHDLEALERRAAAGEVVSEYERFILEFTIRRIRGDEIVRRAKALSDLTEEQQARVDSIVLGEEVMDLVLESMGGPDAIAKAGKRMLEILDSGACPDMEQNANAWSVLSRYGEQIGSADLLDRCAAGLRKHFGGEQRMLDWAQSLEEKGRGLRKQ